MAQGGTFSKKYSLSIIFFSPWMHLQTSFSVSLRVCGSYADMNIGLPSEACKDFSGGVHMNYLLREAHSAGHDEELWLSLSRATGCNSMVCCATAQKGVRTRFLEGKLKKKIQLIGVI